jgi:molecular chaperone DnaK
MKLGEAVYKSQQKPETKKTSDPKDAKPNDKDNVVDADFEDVKEKEEDKEKSA